MINTSKLTEELKAAGIPVSGCNSNGVVWDIDGKTEIQKRHDVLAVISSHDPARYEAVELAIKTRRENARNEASLATQLKALTPQQAVDYIETNVKDLASAKNVLKIMARMLIAMRDEVFPELPEE